ncbi:hypothetical protein COO60DRAFT_520281 [Scenedesmus sp. NREL 46B-D3]|nr:hypothetical protein COO60DRAFT_520281 [Scenedesmus sp. NREL 46B-D3]
MVKHRQYTCWCCSLWSHFDSVCRLWILVVPPWVMFAFVINHSNSCDWLRGVRITAGSCQLIACSCSAGRGVAFLQTSNRNYVPWYDPLHPVQDNFGWQQQPSCAVLPVGSTPAGVLLSSSAFRPDAALEAPRNVDSNIWVLDIWSKHAICFVNCQKSLHRFECLPRVPEIELYNIRTSVACTYAEPLLCTLMTITCAPPRETDTERPLLGC